MTTLTRQERDYAHYRSEDRACVKCGEAYPAGSYSEHRAGDRHQLRQRQREELAELRGLEGETFSAEYCSELLGVDASAMLGSDLIALLEG